MKTLNYVVLALVAFLVACGSDMTDIGVASLIDLERQQNRWMYEEIRDEFTGETIYAAGQEQDNAVFLVSCNDNKEFLVTFTVLNEESRGGFMQYRLDDSEIRNIEFHATDSVMTMGGTRAAEFMLLLANSQSQKLIVRIPVEQYEWYDHVDETFTLEGMGGPVSQVATQCSRTR